MSQEFGLRRKIDRLSSDKKYDVIVSKDALKRLKSIPENYKKKIEKRIRNLSYDPRPPQSRKLKEYQNSYRIRQGDYRVIYEILDKEIRVVVVDIGNRDAIYKKKA